MYSYGGKLYEKYGSLDSALKHTKPLNPNKVTAKTVLSQKVWIISEYYFTDMGHIIAICTSGKIAEKQLLDYLECLAINADELLDDKRFIEEIERLNKARNYILREPLDKMGIGEMRFAEKIGVSVYDLITKEDEING